MKNILVLISILFLSFNVLAKSPGKTQVKSKANVASKKYAKDAFKFDLKVYYKLKFPDRKKYLMAYVDFIRAVNSELQDKKNAEFNLMRLLFPTADAQYGVDHCYTGGIYYPISESVNGSCGSGYKSTYFPEQLKTVFSGCTNNNRCAAYFGLDSSGGGLCFKTEGNATNECLEQSSPEAIDRLNQALANKYDPKAVALQAALDLDLRNNNLIAKHCLDKSSKNGKCEKLSATVAEYRNKVQSVPTSNPISVGNDQHGKGCAQAEIDAISASMPLAKKDTPAGEKDVSQRVNPIWYKMLTMGAAGACPGGVFYDDLVQKLGLCKATSAMPDVEADLRNRDNLRNAVNNLVAGKNVEKGDQWSNFTNYFGVSPDEFKKVICAKDTASARVSTLGTNGKPGLLPNVFGGSGEQFKQRRAEFKSCVESNITLQPDNMGEQNWRSNSHLNTCHFKPASARFQDMLANPSKYKGKYYFSDNANGNCYSLDRVSTSCGDIGTMTERQSSKVYCTQAEAPAAGQISMASAGYLRLDPVHRSDNSDRIVRGEDMSSQFTFFQMDCGANATLPCNADNDYCRGSDSSADR